MAEASTTSATNGDIAGGEPPPIKFKVQPFDIDFHANESHIAIGLITGSAFVYRYDQAKNSKVAVLKNHTESCRSVRFTPDGNGLLTGSADHSICIVDLQNGGTNIRKVPQAHDYAINKLFFVDANTLASGDDEGVIKVWDTRQQTLICQFHENADYISDMAFHKDSNMLLATSGDGTLAVYDLRRRKLEALSDHQDDELLSIQLMKNGRKVVCGMQEGVLGIFSWGYFGDVSDRFPGHPSSVDTMVRLSEDILCTGSSDGIIRLVNIQPNKIVGVIGEHSELPIERLALSKDGKLLGSCSHDNTVRFWNLEHVFDSDEAEEEEEAVDVKEQEAMVQPSAEDSMETEPTGASHNGTDSVGQSMAIDNSDSDSSDDSEGGGAAEGGSLSVTRSRRKGKGKMNGPPATMKNRNNFFADL